jgi:hypothetical protein
MPAFAILEKKADAWTAHRNSRVSLVREERRVRLRGILKGWRLAVADSGRMVLKMPANQMRQLPPGTIQSGMEWGRCNYWC